MVAKLQLDSTSHLSGVADKLLAAPVASLVIHTALTAKPTNIPSTTQAIRLVDQRTPTEAPKVPGDATTTITTEAKKRACQTGPQQYTPPVYSGRNSAAEGGAILASMEFVAQTPLVRGYPLIPPRSASIVGTNSHGAALLPWRERYPAACPPSRPGSGCPQAAPTGGRALTADRAAESGWTRGARPPSGVRGTPGKLDMCRPRPRADQPRGLLPRLRVPIRDK